MATYVPDRANDPRRQPWKSAWPVGHPNHRDYVSPEEQAANLRAKNPGKFDELTKNNGVPDYKPREEVAWRSAWPKGHPNYREYVPPKD